MSGKLNQQVYRIFKEAKTMSISVDISIMAIIMMLCIHQLHQKNFYKTLQDSCHLLILCSVVIISCVMLYKLRLFAEELFYIDTDHNGDIVSVIKSTLNFNVPSWMVIAVTVFSVLILVINSNLDFVYIIKLSPSATLLAVAFCLLLFYSINIMECRATKVTAVFSSGGLDPGTAMACSYFYGYLKIILPASGGNERAGIIHSMEKYEAANNVQIPVKKLFILIPSSAYIPPDYREISQGWLKPTTKLEVIELDRAGTKGRTYHNTVYKLCTQGPNINSTTIHLVTEGATPLKTFLEVQQNTHRYAPLYVEYNREIIRNFYLTLQNLLKDNPDCKDVCELVYYEDNIDGQTVNPARVLLDRLSLLQN